jgi:hypothetical protein
VTMRRLHAAALSLKRGSARLTPKTWPEWAAAVVVVGALVSGIGWGISHLLSGGESTPFVDRVDRICFDAAGRYQVASGPSIAAAKERAAIAADVVEKLRRLSAPADDLFDYDSLVVDKTHIANLRDQIYRTKRDGRTTRRLDARLLNEQRSEQTTVQYEMQDLLLRVCGHLKPELE